MLRSILATIASSPMMLPLLLAGDARAQGPLPDLFPYHEPWYVRTNGNDASDGRSWATAFQTIERALTTVEPDGQIWVGQGTYTPAGSFGFPITRPLKIYGGFVGNETSIGQRPPTNQTTLDGAANSKVHVVEITEMSTSQVVIDGFLIQRGGYTNGLPGGGIYAPCANLFLSHVTVQQCVGAYFGGGIYFGGGCVTTNPDAIAAELPSAYPRRLSMKYCTIRQNFAEWYGGGIHGSAVFGEIANSTIADNGCNRSGGGCYLTNQGQSNVLDFVGCVFSGNLALNGTAGSAAGLGLSNFVDDWVANATLINCTFYRNLVGTPPNYADDGGALSVEVGSTCMVRNSIVWENFAPPQNPFQNEMLGTVSVQHSDVQTSWSGIPSDTDNISFDPLFVSSTNLDLQAGSLCIDSANYANLPHDNLDVDRDGNTSEILPLDIIKRQRTVDDPNVTGVLDMGAFERPYP